MIKGGYAGKLLFVDLTDGTIVGKSLSEEIAQRFLTPGYFPSPLRACASS